METSRGNESEGGISRAEVKQLLHELNSAWHFIAAGVFLVMCGVPNLVGFATAERSWRVVFAFSLQGILLQWGPQIMIIVMGVSALVHGLRRQHRLLNPKKD